MGYFIKHKNRYDFLEYLFNKRKIKTLETLIKHVIRAEKEGVLVVKGNVEKQYSDYVKNVRWYMGELERSGRITGFLKRVGRPIKPIPSKAIQKAEREARLKEAREKRSKLHADVAIKRRAERVAARKELRNNTLN